MCLFIKIILYFCEVFTVRYLIERVLEKNFNESQIQLPKIELDAISFTSKFKTLLFSPLTTIEKLELNRHFNNLNKREI